MVDAKKKEYDIKGNLSVIYSDSSEQLGGFDYNLQLRIQNWTNKVLVISNIEFYSRIKGGYAEIDFEESQTIGVDQTVLVDLYINSFVVNQNTPSFVILTYVVNNQELTKPFRVKFSRKIVKHKIASLWYQTHEIEYVLAGNFLDRSYSFHLLLEASYEVFSNYGFYNWVLYLANLLHYNMDYYQLFTSCINNTFVNMITGWKGCGRYHKIQSRRELLHHITFLELNTPIETLDLKEVLYAIYSEAKKRHIKVDEWTQIRSILDLSSEYSLVSRLLILLKTVSTSDYDGSLQEFIHYLHDNPCQPDVGFFQKLFKPWSFKTLIYRLEQELTCTDLSKEENLNLIIHLCFMLGLKHWTNNPLQQIFFDLGKELGKRFESDPTLQALFTLHSFYFNEIQQSLRKSTLSRISDKINRFIGIKLGYYSIDLEIYHHLLIVEAFLQLKRQAFFHREYKLAKIYATKALEYTNILADYKKRYFRRYMLKIKKEEQLLKESTPYFLFIFDTNLLCYLIDYSLLDVLSLIAPLYEESSISDYIAPPSILSDLPVRYKDNISLIRSLMNFQQYTIGDTQKQFLVEINENLKRPTFDKKEYYDYNIIQNAIEYNESDIVPVIVTNDEGIRKFVEQNFFYDGIRSIWVHTFFKYSAKLTSDQRVEKKLLMTADIIEHKLNDYRQENKRDKAVLSLFERALLLLQHKNRNETLLNSSRRGEGLSRLNQKMLKKILKKEIIRL